MSIYEIQRSPDYRCRIGNIEVKERATFFAQSKQELLMEVCEACEDIITKKREKNRTLKS